MKYIRKYNESSNSSFEVDDHVTYNNQKAVITDINDNGMVDLDINGEWTQAHVSDLSYNEIDEPKTEPMAPTVGDTVLYDGSKAIVKHIFKGSNNPSDSYFPTTLRIDWNDEIIEVGIDEIEPYNEEKVKLDQIKRVEDTLIYHTKRTKDFLEKKIDGADGEMRDAYVRSYLKIIPDSYQDEKYKG